MKRRQSTNVSVFMSSDGDQHFLSVVHITADSLDFITPVQVTESHVIVDISGFSSYGLVRSEACSSAISGLVLLFFEWSKNSLYVLLLPRNICLTQVHTSRHRLRPHGPAYRDTCLSVQGLRNI